MKHVIAWFLAIFIIVIACSLKAEERQCWGLKPGKMYMSSPLGITKDDRMKRHMKYTVIKLDKEVPGLVEVWIDIYYLDSQNPKAKLEKSKEDERFKCFRPCYELTQDAKPVAK